MKSYLVKSMFGCIVLLATGIGNQDASPLANKPGLLARPEVSVGLGSIVDDTNVSAEQLVSAIERVDKLIPGVADKVLALVENDNEADAKEGARIEGEGNGGEVNEGAGIKGEGDEGEGGGDDCDGEDCDGEDCDGGDGDGGDGDGGDVDGGDGDREKVNEGADVVNDGSVSDRAL